MKIFPVASVQRAGSGAIWRKKHGGEVAVFYAGEILATLPDAGTPVVDAFEFFVREDGDFSVFAVEGVDGFDGRGICDGEVTESAEPGESGLDGLAVQLGGDIDADDIAAIEMKVLGDFQVAVAPGKLQIGGRTYWGGGGRVVRNAGEKAHVCGPLQFHPF